PSAPEAIRRKPATFPGYGFVSSFAAGRINTGRARGGPVIASVHLADVGVRSALAMIRKTPPAASIDGLRQADIGLAAPLRGASLPAPQLGRVALVAFWDDDFALDRFLADHPLAAKLAPGWHLRLAPLRAYGTWPGLPSDVPPQRAVEHEGPVAVL